MVKIASPTATSAAATAITKKTNTCPLESLCKVLNATSKRFTAFNISSMHINNIIVFLRAITPIAPMMKITVLRSRYILIEIPLIILKLDLRFKI